MLLTSKKFNAFILALCLPIAFYATPITPKKSMARRAGEFLWRNKVYIGTATAIAVAYYFNPTSRSTAATTYLQKRTATLARGAARRANSVADRLNPLVMPSGWTPTVPASSSSSSYSSNSCVSSPKSPSNSSSTSQPSSGLYPELSSASGSSSFPATINANKVPPVAYYTSEHGIIAVIAPGIAVSSNTPLSIYRLVGLAQYNWSGVYPTLNEPVKV